jgi:competence ComEA-like helix-hairpin-helix protein
LEVLDMVTRTRPHIDINTASAREIERACGIDGVLADRIVNYRDEHGPFASRDDLDAVPGFAEVRTAEVLRVVDLPAHRGRATRRRTTDERRTTTTRRATTSRRGVAGHSTTAKQPSSRSAESTTDHEFIQNWVEERGGWPACVKGTGRSSGDVGMIRIDFPGFTGSESLERIEWDEWFRQFDENKLAFLHRDMKHRDGQLDRFNKLVKRRGGRE